MRKITVDGNEACASTAYMFTEVAGIYPITPSSPMAESIDNWSDRKNIFNDSVKVVEMQSEAGAAGLVHGSLQSGLLTTTFTASQGLLLMIPNMYKMAGEMLPAVIHVAARSLATHALSIFGDHQDIYATRQTGFCILASSSVENANHLAAVAHLSSIKSSIPFLHFFDGFRTSHEIDKINALELEDIKPLVPYDSINKFRAKALNPNKPFTRGTAENDDVYFQITESRNNDYNKVADIVEKYMMDINKIANTDYKPFNYYGSKTAKKVIVAMGSVTETIKSVIDYEKGDIGLIEVHLYRPFSVKHLLNVLPSTVESIAVLDRTKEAGSIGEPLYLDVVAALKDKNINIVGGRYGLSSKDTNAAMIKAVFDMLDNPKNNFTIGINDDVTNLSLEVDKTYKISNSLEFLVYGYGSDGMVSACKSIIKLVGNLTDKYVQGYFQYDSKKSGGVTIGHLRFDDNKIKSTYYVENPKLVVCTKDTYLDKYNMLEHIKENGIFILNTEKDIDELNKINNDIKKIILEKNIKFYTINAYKLAEEINLPGKISTIMESVILYLSNVIDYDRTKEEMKLYAKNKFSKKGDDVVLANYKAIDEAVNYLKEVNLDNLEGKFVSYGTSLYEEMSDRKGDSIPVSKFIPLRDGTFMPNTSKFDKRGISSSVPTCDISKCIMCNKCSFICPHAVIRPFLIDEEEYSKLPDNIKNKCKKPVLPALKDYYYLLSFSVMDCTGCKVCINNCPNKALSLTPLNSKEQEIYNYLSKNIKDKHINKDNVINSQFTESKFKYSGACQGCGETPYIKVLTQLFGDNMIIANATGCSSIYGGSVPSTPYNLPWSNSLFEDNAEYGYGILIGNKTIRDRIKTIMENNMDNPNHELFELYINNIDNYDITKQVYDSLDYNTCPKELNELKDYIAKRSVWAIGGDGWAYDIGYGGIDHVLSTNDNVNILVLDSQVYSNTGGQASKASPKGAVALFAAKGKQNAKKDLARIALSYPHVYVATVSMGANMNQLLKVFKEAENYNGPSIIIAYSPCISHGIKGGMENSILMEKLATECGYFPIFHYNPVDKKFTLDSKNVNFDLYDEFLSMQNRYSMLKKVNEDHYKELLESNKNNAISRYNYYKELDNK